MLQGFHLEIDLIVRFLMVLTRVGAILAVIPMLGSGNTPMRAKVVLSFFFTLAIFPMVKSTIGTTPLVPFAYAYLIFKEILFGALFGFIARFVFTAVEMGGTIISYQMGFAAANVFDPANNRQVPLMSQFQGTLTLMLFLIANAHHVFFRGLVESYQVVPIGGAKLTGDVVPYIIDMAGRMFSIGVQLSAPVLVILLISGLALGILARVFPQLNVFLLSFPLNIGLALIILGLTLSLSSAVINREFIAIGDRFLDIIHLAAGT